MDELKKCSYCDRELHGTVEQCVPRHFIECKTCGVENEVPRPAIPSLTDAEIHDMISDEIGSEALGISEVSLLRLVRATEKVVIERMKGGGK